MRPSSTATEPGKARSAVTTFAFLMRSGRPSRNSMSLAFVLLEERLGGQGAEIVERRAERCVVPVPPGERIHPFADVSGEPRLDRRRRNAADDRIRFDGARDHRARADRRSVADANARHDRRAMADPDVVADADGVLAPPVEDALVALRVRPIVVGAIGEMM